MAEWNHRAAAQTLDNNPRLRLARELVEHTGVNVFLTGKAGTGKTTFLRRLREETGKRIVVLAPTGIAAINAGGMTIHSFFQLDFAPFFPGVGRTKGRKYDRFRKDKLRVIRSLDLLVIDEVSMVRSDLLDAVDDVLRRQRDPSRPFGGVQLLLIGDLHQLPPVVKEDEWTNLSRYYRSPYFFDSHALASTDYVTVELDRVYRQNEGEFLNLLNRIRTNTADSAVLASLNRRHIPGFKAPKREKYVRLTTHNFRADSINEECMKALRTPPVIVEAEVSGIFPESSFPAARKLILKEGAQVMFIKNDPSGAQEYYNGLLGEVIEASVSDGIKVRAADTERIINVSPVTWDNVKYEIDPKTNAITEDIIGSFVQLPLRPAWAITIHKSQGLTFDRAIIDAASSFAHGQTYVALSRCRTLEGLVLENPLTMGSIITDPMVSLFMSEQEKRVPDAEGLKRLTVAYSVKLLNELFGFERLNIAFTILRRTVDEAFSALYPRICGAYASAADSLDTEVRQVAARFAHQFVAIIQEHQTEPENIPLLQDRIRAGAKYFREKLHALNQVIRLTPTEHDSQEMVRRVKEHISALQDVLNLQYRLLDKYTEETFSTSGYLAAKAEIVLAIEKGHGSVTRGNASKTRLSASKTTSARKERFPVPEGVNPTVYRGLFKWRKEKSEETGRFAFTILPNKTLVALATDCPTDLDSLSLVKGMGPIKLRAYGEELVDLISSLV